MPGLDPGMHFMTVRQAATKRNGSPGKPGNDDGSLLSVLGASA
jgi:hypothetical protein